MAIPMEVIVEDSSVETEDKEEHTTSQRKEGATAPGSAVPLKAYTYKTRHATEIAKTIGHTEDLKQFDDL